MNFTTPYLLGTVLFSSIGMGAFIYGKSQKQWGIFALGIILMIYPYAVNATWMLYAIGTALTAGLFFFRE
jgi:hypothetical protein